MTKVLRGIQTKSSAPLIDGIALVQTASGKAKLFAETFARSHTLTAGLHHHQTKIAVAKSVKN